MRTIQQPPFTLGIEHPGLNDTRWLSQYGVTVEQDPVIIRVNEDQKYPLFIAGSEVLAVEVGKEALPGWYCLFDNTGNMRFAKDPTDTSKVAHRLKLVGLCRPL